MSLFEPSSKSHGHLGAVDPALVQQLIGAGTAVAETALTKQRPGAAKKRHKAKMEEIAAAEPDHSPMLVPAIVLGIALIGGVVLFTRPKPVPVRMAA